MIIVAGYMTLDPAVLPDFKAEFAKLRPLVLEEPGVLHYSLLVEDEGAGVVNVSEMWDDDDALRTHLALPRTAAFFARFGSSVTAMTAQVYDLSNPRPIPL